MRTVAVSGDAEVPCRVSVSGRVSSGEGGISSVAPFETRRRPGDEDGGSERSVGRQRCRSSRLRATDSPIGTARFELATPRSQSECATRLRHVPCSECRGAAGESRSAERETFFGYDPPLPKRVRYQALPLKVSAFGASTFSGSRDGQIRTGDPSLPKRVRYQAAPRPVLLSVEARPAQVEAAECRTGFRGVWPALSSYLEDLWFFGADPGVIRPLHRLPWRLRFGGKRTPP